MARNATTNGNSTPVEPCSLVPTLGMAAYRAPSLFQPHRAREALADAHAGRIPPLIGFFCGLGCPPVTKWVAPLGWDIIWIDWEHASMNIETMTQVGTSLPRSMLLY
jgi:4-hydroxy-2-oxoheptanedioate aldolase